VSFVAGGDLALAIALVCAAARAAMACAKCAVGETLCRLQCGGEGFVDESFRLLSPVPCPVIINVLSRPINGSQRTGLCAGVAFNERQARNESRLKNR